MRKKGGKTVKKLIKRMAPLILALAVILGSLPGFLNAKTVYAEERLKDLGNILVELGYSDAKVIRGIPGAEPVVPTQEDIDYLRQKENKSFSILASRLPGLNSTKQFHVQNAETGNYYTINTTLKRIGAHSLIYVEDGRTLEDAFLDRVVREFEKIYDKNVEVFGTPPDVDKDPHIKIVLLDIQDGSTGGTYVAGFFDSINELPAQNHPNKSNECEVFFMDVVEGLRGEDTESVTNSFFGTLAHEFQHMIQYGVYLDNISSNTDYEKVWLDEAMADLAIYVNGYGHPESHIIYYLANSFPYGSGLTDWSYSDPMANYGASYMFGLYMYEKLGTQFIKDLVRNPKTGSDSINDQLAKDKINTSFDELFEKSQVAVVVDEDNSDFGYDSIDVSDYRKLIYSLLGPEKQFVEFKDYNGTSKSFNTYNGRYKSFMGLFTGERTEPALNLKFGNTNGAYYFVKANINTPINSVEGFNYNNYVEFLDGEKVVEKIQPDTVNGNTVIIDEEQVGAMIYIATAIPVNNTLEITEESAPSLDDQPTTPKNLIAQSGYNVVKLSWTPSSYTGGVTGYNIYRNGSKINNELVKVTLYTDYSVAPATTYTYEVEAIGEDAKASDKVAKTTNTLAEPSVKAPAAPSLEFVGTYDDATGATIELKINATNTENIFHFEITALEKEMQKSYFMLGAAYTNMTVSYNNFKSGETYLLYAFAVNANGYSPASNKIRVKAGNGGGLVTIQPPTQPTNLRAVYIGEDEVTLEWNASSSSSGILEYNVYRDGVFAGKTIETQYLDTGLTKGTEYAYTVEAIDDSSDQLSSGLSEPLKVTTIESQPVPELTPDTTSNTVDNSLDITFTDHVDWRSNIVEITVGNTALTASQYSIAPGKITIKQGVITKAGDYEITVRANNYNPLTVTQSVKAGKLAAEKTTVEVNPAFDLGTESTITVTAKDQYGNLVKGEQLYTDVTIINNDGETDEEYIVAGYVYKESDKNVEFVVPTNENGKTSMKVRIPSHVDENDGISIQFKTDGGTKAGSAVGFIAGSIPPVNTTVQVSPSLSSGKTSIVTIIARDEKGRAIKNHQFYADIIIINHDKTNNESYTVSDHVYRASNTNVKVGRKTDANGITTFQITIPNVVDKNDGISIQLKTDINGYAIGEPIKFIESSSGGGSGGGGSGSGGSGGSGGGSGSVSQNNNKINVTKEMVKNASGETLTVTISSSAKEPAVYVNGDALKELISQRKSLAVKTNDVAITIPSSAVASIDDDQQAKITVKELDSKEAEDKLKDASKNAGKGLFAIGGRVFEFTAEIEDKKGDKETLRFNSDITVAISLAGMDLSTINVEKLGVYYYNESTEEWEYVGGVYNPKTNTITFTTRHFSLYAVMEYNKTFADIASHWAKNEIEIIAAKHIMVGVDDTHFEPDRSITRAEFAAILARTLKLEPDQASVQFVDVPEGKWYYDYISAATKAGLIKGVDSNHFAPDANITREQMATMITRAYTYLYGGIGLPDIPNANDGNLSIFTDRSNISGYARASISFVINEKLVDGRTQTTFEPKANATRAEVAVALYRFIKLMERK